MGGRSVESVRISGYFGNIGINEISLVSLFNFFCWCFCFYNKCIFSLKDFIIGN